MLTRKDSPKFWNNTFRILGLCLFITPLSLWAHGDVDQRIDILSEKISQHEDAGLLLKRAALYQDDGHALEAWHDYQRVLVLKPKQVDALYLGAKAALKLGRVEDAASLAQRFYVQLGERPNKIAKARAYQLFSDVYLKKSNKALALSYLQKSLALQTHPAPDLLLNLAKMQLQQKNYPMALNTLEQGLETSGVNVSVQQKIVSMAIIHKDYPTALRYLDLQLKKSASLRNVILLVEKFEVLLLAGEKIQAEAIREQALSAFQQLPAKRKTQMAAKLAQKRLLLH
jgi:tetratricopeptide (TPR) repeat protein